MVIIQVPAGMPEHNSLAVEIGSYLKSHLTAKFTVLYDTFCYVPHEVLEKLGHFKNGDPHEYMQQRLMDLGASPSFIAETVTQLLKQGIMPSSYAPDVCVVHDRDFENRFRVPIGIGEIVSKDTHDYDLYFKAYLYERLGVEEYFVFETERRAGKLLRAYRFHAEAGLLPHYRELAIKHTSVRSETFGIEVPVAWKL